MNNKQIIFRKDSKSLSVCNRVRIFEGEKNVDCFEFMIPSAYNDTDLTKCDITLVYITPDNNEHYLLINDFKQDESYKDLNVYIIDIDEKFTSLAGELKMYLKFTNVEDSKDVILETSTATIDLYQIPVGESSITPEKQDIVDEILLRSKEAIDMANSVVERANSGEFNGKDGVNGIDGKNGVDGKDGINGTDGYTPQKGIDYFDGEKGEKGDKGEQGTQGIQGEKGADGKTPVKGTDYFTTEDIEEIENAVKKEIDIPTKTSDLTNDSNFISDDNYNHTDNNFTNENKKKLISLENYDDTEIKNEIQNINKDWKLIQEIEVTEDLNVIEATTDSDGNTFECDDIFIEFSNILGTNGANLGVQLYPSSLRPSSTIGTLLANPISATAKRNFFVKFTKLKGVNKYWSEVFGKNATAYTNTYAHCQSNVSVVITDDYKVRQIRIYFSGSNVINAGTIRVYGR